MIRKLGYITSIKISTENFDIHSSSLYELTVKITIKFNTDFGEILSFCSILNFQAVYRKTSFTTHRRLHFNAFDVN